MTEPANLEAEQAVLGACLIDRDAILHVATKLNPEDFQTAKHQRIYRAILDLYYDRVPADILTVSEKLGDDEAYLAELIASTPTSVHAGYYAGIVAEHATRRRIIRAGQEIVKAGHDAGLSLDELLVLAEEQVQRAALDRDGGTVETLGEAMGRFVGTLDDGPPVFTSFGYPRLDDMLGGMEPGTVTIVAGRPSHGKTGFVFGTAMAVAERAARRVLYISLEMSNDQMVHRALSMRTGMDSRKIRARYFDDAERWIVEEAARQIYDWPLELTKSWGADITQVCNQVRSYHAARGIDLLIIDGLWLLEWAGAKGNRVAEVGKISRMVKLLAMELNIPVMLCHQLNRAMMGRTEKTPILSDLRESGDVEQDADIVIFVNRPGLLDESGQEPRDYGHIIVAKNRQGPVGRLAMRFNETTTTFADYAPRRHEMAAD